MSFLLQVKSFLENGTDGKKNNMFSSYDSLDIAPHHVFKSIDEQKSAVFELCKGITGLFKTGRDE